MNGMKFVLLLVGFTLLCVGCGKSQNKDLRLRFISAESGFEKDALMLGVTEQSIAWISQSHGNRSFAWDGTSALPFSPEPGDHIRYTGSANGVTLVSGEAVVGSENPLIVPLRRAI